LATTGVANNALLLPPDAPANPCGLVAKSFFNDTYKIIDATTNTSIVIAETGIAWESDVQYKFKNLLSSTIPAANISQGQTNWTYF